MTQGSVVVAMSKREQDVIATLLADKQGAILDRWVAKVQVTLEQRKDLITGDRLREESAELLRELADAVNRAGSLNLEDHAFAEFRRSLTRLARERARSQFSPRETALYVFFLKETLDELLHDQLEGDAETVLRCVHAAEQLLVQAALDTFESYVEGREQVIQRQRGELLELVTPVVSLWRHILALPLIGTLDSDRTQVAMETLLNAILKTEARVVILDITGVPTVDTEVAQHLVRTVEAARLMGVECLITGIRPTIAQTLVQLGLDLGGVRTRATLAEGLREALALMDQQVVGIPPSAPREDRQANP